MGIPATIQSRILCFSPLFKNMKIKIYRTIILPAFLKGCETGSLTLQEEQTSRVQEKDNKEDIWDDFHGYKKTLKNFCHKLHNLYSPNIIRVIK